MTFEAIDSPRSDEILEAALCCFADKGFGPTRVEDIARKAGLSKGAVYLYFKSKEDMLQAAVQRSVGLMVRAANQLTLTAGSKNPEKALRVFHKMVMQSLSDPDLSAAPRIVLAEAARFPELAQFYRDEAGGEGFSAPAASEQKGAADDLEQMKKQLEEMQKQLSNMQK